MFNHVIIKAVLSIASFFQVASITPNGVAPGCINRVACTWTDTNVPAGPHFYFVIAGNGSNFSGPSNRVDVDVAAGQKVTLNWSPSMAANGAVDPSVTYYVYRGAPATNLKVTGVQ